MPICENKGILFFFIALLLNNWWIFRKIIRTFPLQINIKTFRNMLNGKTYADLTKISFFAYMPAINYYRYFWRNKIDAYLYVRYYAWKHILMDVVGEDRIILSLGFVVSRFSNLMLVLQISCIMFGKCYIIIMIPH